MNFILKEITSLCKELKECAKANPKKVLFIIGVLIYTFWDAFLVYTITPVKCKLDINEKHIFIPKEKWKEKYPTEKHLEEKWYFLDEENIPHPGHDKEIYFNDLNFTLYKISRKYPNMAAYIYKNNSYYFINYKYLYFDNKEKEPILLINHIEGRFKLSFSALGYGSVRCEANEVANEKLYEYIDSY
ncbi:hypothetical protein [Bibersteinia trehalosi]|uniref:hypothetical protein n=1 Tax=Bibersteinia trehalosi TaxID=47735 RepID=UPI00163A3EF3|nr:hypothetical protein [Bibersteinia trehalosi]